MLNITTSIDELMQARIAQFDGVMAHAMQEPQGVDREKWLRDLDEEHKRKCAEAREALDRALRAHFAAG